MASEEQIALAEKLQMQLLQSFADGFTEGTITPTDRATLARLLRENGWTLDPSQKPKSAADLIPKLSDARKIAHEDVDVIGRIA